MLFSYKSSALAAVLMLASTVVRAQFQGGLVQIRNSQDQVVFVQPGAGPQAGSPVFASSHPPEDANIWHIAPVDNNEYVITEARYGQDVTGYEGEPLVTTSQSERWMLKPSSDGFYSIQQVGGNLRWTSIPHGEDQGIYLENEDSGSPAQQFAFISDNEN